MNVTVDEVASRLPFATEYMRKAAEWSDIQDHLPFLYHTVLAYRNPVVVEFGTRSGVSTSAFLAALEAQHQLGPGWQGGHLWSVDIDPPQVPAYWHDSDLWTFHQGDDLNMQAVLPQQIDILFIDTSHTYEQTLAELRAYVPKVRDGGIVLMHDTQWLPPAISLTAPGGPVTEALDAWSVETGINWVNRQSGESYYGLGVIRL